MSSWDMQIGVSTACIVLATMLVAHRARGDDAHGRANALFQQGAAAARRGDHDQAYAAFAESYRLWPRGATLGNVAWAEVELGRALAGFRHLKEAVRTADLDEQRRAVVQENIKEVYAKLGHIAIEADQDARVTVDGVTVDGMAPLEEPLDVMPGRHALEASVGTMTRRTEVDARAGTVLHVDMHVAPESIVLPPAATTVATPTPTASPSTLRETPTNDIPMARTWWTPPHALGVGLGAAAIVGAGIGLSFAVASQAAADDARHLRAELGQGACVSGSQAGLCASLRDKLDTIHTDDSIAHVGLVVGGAAVVGAAIAFLVGVHDQTRTGVQWTVGPGACAVRGTF